MKSLLIIGAGGHGRVVAETAMACGYEHLDFLDDNSADAIGKTDQLEQLSPGYDGVIVSIGNNAKRKELLDRVTNPISLVHPHAFVSPSAKIGKGSIILPGAVINTNVKIGRGCIISIGALIDHDAEIGDDCHINTGAVICAGAHVGSETKIEAGQIIK